MFGTIHITEQSSQSMFYIFKRVRRIKWNGRNQKRTVKDF